MPRKQRQLQWHKASGQWCKRYSEPTTGKKPVIYLGKGNPGPNNKGVLDFAYDNALLKWEAIEAQLSGARQDQQRLERLDAISVEQQLTGDLSLWADGRSEADDLEEGATVEEARHLRKQRLTISQLAREGDWVGVASLAQRLAQNPSEDDTRTFGAKIDEFLGEKLLQARSGQRSCGRYVNLESRLIYFRNWHGAERSIDEISSGTLRDFYQHLMCQLSDEDATLKSTHSARDFFQIAKQFIRWLAENEHIAAMPSNIDSRQLVIETDEPDPKYMSPDQFRRLLDVSTDRSKLYWLLMANCGMTQVDISEMKPSAIDWEKGILTYKRRKIKRKKTRKARTYKLWPETLELLRKLAKRSGSRALTTRTGTPLVNRTVKTDGRKVNGVAITNAFNRAKAEAGLDEFSATDIRNTVATVLRNSEHAHAVGLYLQHRNNTTDAHYAADYDNALDAPLDFVRQRLLHQWEQNG